MIGQKSISVATSEVFSSTVRLWASVSDRRSAVESLLREFPDLSDRLIAARSRVSRNMVEKIRANLVAQGSIPEKTSRIGRDGKTYRVNGLSQEKRRKESAEKLGELTRKLTRMKDAIEESEFVTTYLSADPNVRNAFRNAFIRLGVGMDRLRRSQTPL